MHRRACWSNFETPLKLPPCLQSPLRQSRLSTLPDSLLLKIIRLYVADNPTSTRIRLVNKHLSSLALSSILHTICLCCPRALQRLLDASFSPLYYEPFTKLVNCLEFHFNPFLYELRGVKVLERRDLSLPKRIDVVRFLFKAGHESRETDSPKEPQLIPSSTWANDTCLNFLKQFNPTRFEWHCRNDQAEDNLTIRVIQTHINLQNLFASWTRLSTVYLDGICLTDQNHHHQNWALLLPGSTPNIYIRGPIRCLERFILQGRVPEKDGKRHQVMRLEASEDTPRKTRLWERLVVGEGKVQVVCKGWPPDQLRDFKDSIDLAIDSIDSATRPQTVQPKATTTSCSNWAAKPLVDFFSTLRSRPNVLGLSLILFAVSIYHMALNW